MIALVLCGIALLLVIAVVVGVSDALHAPARRLLAAERRERWEARARAEEADPPGGAPPSHS